MNSSQIYHLVLLAFFLVAIFSCQDKFINDLDIDLPEEEQLLVINLELTEGDSTASTFVARTANLDEVDHTFFEEAVVDLYKDCLLYTSPSPRDRTRSRMPSSA